MSDEKQRLMRDFPLEPLKFGEFEAGTGLMGCTEPGQKVTPENVEQLPPGSVVQLEDGSRLIHLHETFWLWCCDCAHCYDRIANLAWRIKDGATLCHVPWYDAKADLRDAERYRWWRAQYKINGCGALVLAQLPRTDVEFDAAVDLAMKG